MSNQYNNAVNSEKVIIEQVKKDIAYIRGEVLARQKNGKYCKYSKVLRSVIVTNLTKEQHINYWKGLYKKSSNSKYCRLILKEINEKLENGLTDLDKIVELERLSTDSEKEKEKVIREITSEEVKE